MKIKNYYAKSIVEVIKTVHEDLNGLEDHEKYGESIRNYFEGETALESIVVAQEPIDITGNLKWLVEADNQKKFDKQNIDEEFAEKKLYEKLSEKYGKK